MDPRVAAFLDELHRAGVAHDATTPDRDDRFRNLEPASGALLGVLARSTGARTVLELGTSNGYSTIWIADALQATGGRLTSVDADAGRSGLAAANLRHVALDRVVDLLIGDGGEVLARSADASFDMVFLDADRSAYVAWWPDLLRLLRPNGLLVVDNVLSHAREVAAFRAIVDATPGVSQALAPTGAGLLLVVRG